MAHASGIDQIKFLLTKDLPFKSLSHTSATWSNMGYGVYHITEFLGKQDETIWFPYFHTSCVLQFSPLSFKYPHITIVAPEIKQGNPTCPLAKRHVTLRHDSLIPATTH